ncbi:MAG: hypothetical protein PHN56_06255, partial [Candidatus Nanoarchaeia archaeon]|nr:hypothetical protein [Candidatus Nanoarchaeia archaeon]
MDGREKTDQEVNLILSQLRQLKVSNFEEYGKKIIELKKDDISTYNKIITILDLDLDDFYHSDTRMSTIQQQTSKNIPPKLIIKNNRPGIKPLPPNPIRIPPKPMNSLPSNKIPPAPMKMPSNVPKLIKRSDKKKSNPAVIAILSMAILGIILLSIIGYFWIANPPTSDTSRNSLRLGYEIFNNLNDTYLNYTFLYNSSNLEFLGKQYYYLNDSKITAIIQTPQRDIISKKQNNYLYYDLSGNYSKIITTSLRINNALVISLYDEVFNLVNGYYTNESGREGVWNLTDIPCAPIFFEIEIDNEEFNDLTQLRYEMCLDNNGIPIAIAKESIYENSYEIIIAYLESQNKEIKNLSFSN